MASNEFYRFVPFNNETQNSENFSCGVPNLDNYIRGGAPQDEKRDLARVFVVLQQNSNAITGYYSLSCASVSKDSFPKKFVKNLPYFLVPVILLGRMAVNKENQKSGLGEDLLTDAIINVYNASKIVALRSLVVDAIDESVIPFYLKYNFRRIEEDKLRLYLPMSSIRKFIEESCDDFKSVESA